ncbi:MAG: hypothetical protein QS99_C0002G0187 [archaeon GW2011_AR4]|nr:MAG: hypothetical protein QS99_C0002G0187 [archaeon GW2011_AR4]
MMKERVNLLRRTETFLWVLLIFTLLLEYANATNIRFRILPSLLLIVMSIFLVWRYLVYKIPLGLKGVSDKSKIPVIATFIFSFILIYLAIILFIR